MITIQELLFNRKLDQTARIKLVRHKDIRVDFLYNLYRADLNKFLQYQREQAKDVFKGVDYIVSFIGEQGTLSRFVGVYRVIIGRRLKGKKESVDGGTHQYVYQIEEVSGFEDLKERVIVDWGGSARAWHQWLSNRKEVIEIQPSLRYKQFTDYFNFILDFKELQEIVRNQNKYNSWKRMLSATKGVYLISDSKSGKLYVGSAYGDDGIWGRWKKYVLTNGHGENKRLKELLNIDKNYATNFSFSILTLLPKTITPDQAIETERLFKRKLGTNSFGHNGN
jgi:hypothetical protein